MPLDAPSTAGKATGATKADGSDGCDKGAPWVGTGSAIGGATPSAKLSLVAAGNGMAASIGNDAGITSPSSGIPPFTRHRK